MGRKPQYQRGLLRLLLANINFYFMLKYHSMLRRAMKENETDNKVGGKNWAGKVLARLG